MKKIALTIKTKSNLFIGGSPKAFEIGGVDQYTVTDYAGNPYIPGSSLKGTLRNIVRELVAEEDDAAAALTKIYQAYSQKLQEEIQAVSLGSMDPDRQKSLKEASQKFQAAASAECLFGVEGFNQTPKLIVADAKLVVNTELEREEQPTIFSLDSKNTVVKTGARELAATPRTYKTIAPNVVFRGELFFQNCRQLEQPEPFIEAAKTLLKKCTDLCSAGYYRLGNSGSRGYGLVEITLEEDTNGKG